MNHTHKGNRTVSDNSSSVIEMHVHIFMLVFLFMFMLSMTAIEINNWVWRIYVFVCAFVWLCECVQSRKVNKIVNWVWSMCVCLCIWMIWKRLRSMKIIRWIFESYECAYAHIYLYVQYIYVRRCGQFTHKSK